jgi:ADP-heptose:LPS heptosyltransferase
MTKALLIHGGAVGDFVMALRVVAALRQAGATRVSVLGRTEIASFAAVSGNIDELLDLDKGGYHTLFDAACPVPREIAALLHRFDLAVDMLGGPGSVLTARLEQIGIRKVVGIDPRPRAEWPSHVSEQWLADLRAAGIQGAPGPPVVRLPEEHRRAGLRRLRDAVGSPDQPIALLHPGSGSPDKCWPLPGFVRLAEMLRARAWSVAFLLGPAEVERFSSTDRGELNAASPTIEGCTLLEAASLLAVAQLYVGNDSGMSHLAAALGTPTLAVFGPTDSHRWGPLGSRVVCVRVVGPGRWPSVEDIARLTVSSPLRPW